MGKVVKRNGMHVPFDKAKVRNAINKANEECAKDSPKSKLDDGVIDSITNKIYNRCRQRVSDTGVEEIQDMVEEELLQNGATEVARCYMRYRQTRTIARDRYKELMDAVAEKLSAKSVKNQNANVDEKSFGGRVGEASNLMMKKFALESCMTEMSRNNHLNNEIYIHDLDAYTDGRHNCLTMPLDDLLKNGFNTRQADIRPAGSISTAFQLVAVLFQLQSLQQFGGVSASHLDWTMVPYVRMSYYKHYKDVVDIIPFIKKKPTVENPRETSILDEVYRGKHWYNFIKRYIAMKASRLTNKELKQAVEGMMHNLNIWATQQ